MLSILNRKIFFLVCLYLQNKNKWKTNGLNLLKHAVAKIIAE